MLCVYLNAKPRFRIPWFKAGLGVQGFELGLCKFQKPGLSYLVFRARDLQGVLADRR